MYVPANPYPLLLNSVCALGSKHLNTSARAPVNPPLSSRKVEMEAPNFDRMSKREIDDWVNQFIPGCLQPAVGCCGGPIPVVEKCMCVLPREQQETVQAAVNRYKRL